MVTRRRQPSRPFYKVSAASYRQRHQSAICPASCFRYPSVKQAHPPAAFPVPIQRQPVLVTRPRLSLLSAITSIIACHQLSYRSRSSWVPAKGPVCDPCKASSGATRRAMPILRERVTAFVSVTAAGAARTGRNLAQRRAPPLPPSSPPCHRLQDTIGDNLDVFHFDTWMNVIQKCACCSFSHNQIFCKQTGSD